MEIPETNNQDSLSHPAAQAGGVPAEEPQEREGSPAQEVAAEAEADEAAAKPDAVNESGFESAESKDFTADPPSSPATNTKIPNSRTSPKKASRQSPPRSLPLPSRRPRRFRSHPRLPLGK